MKVKCGALIYDSKDIPICILLSDMDKENIKNMIPEAHKYASFPEYFSKRDAEEFMKFYK